MELDAKTFRRVAAAIEDAERYISEVMGRDVSIRVVDPLHARADSSREANAPTPEPAPVNGGMTDKPRRTLYDIQQPRPKLDRAGMLALVKRTVDIVSRCLNLEAVMVTGRSRIPKYVDARLIIYKLVRGHYPEVSLEIIGTVVNRDHSTVCHNVKIADEYIKSDAEFRAKYKACKQPFHDAFDIKEDRAKV